MKSVRWFIRIFIGICLLMVAWWIYYDAMTGPKRRLSKREKRMVAELGPKLASDARFGGVAFQGDHSDHSNVLMITGTVASVEAEAALYDF